MFLVWKKTDYNPEGNQNKRDIERNDSDFSCKKIKIAFVIFNYTNGVGKFASQPRSYNLFDHGEEFV